MASKDISYDVLIIGQGAAAYAAALYAARYQIKPIIFGATFGGETATGGSIENYPGISEIDGFDLMMRFREQAESNDVPIVDENIVSAARMEDCFQVITESGDLYQGASVILAVGRERRKLGLENETEWMGRGVSFCATCDAPMHRGNTVGIVGGGDAAVKGAVLLSKYADQVYIIYRGDRFTRPEAMNIRQLEERTNLHTIFNTNVVGLEGTDGLEGVVLDREFNGSRQIKLAGIFIEIGADPRVELANQLGVKLNDTDEVMVDKHGATSVDGVFAAGDLTDAAGDLKQTITAAAGGALAATAAYEYVSEHGNRCGVHAMGYALV
ncbi:MAG: thioredoxin reductase [SAR202 cluster bacterium]|jgi:thioredoxin reductase (NADPH)|nr:thioredoxin reductase [Chloroflexota bacterium]MDP6420215.1 FAD-dependent oxidoreductase [SAR202 cluster bacterium]HAL48811.1 thioredoxin reductase [Dehalococcoidia bacterium]MDP6664932.1 FAD-dependent oxidoreductase [SAR202 cluster bacterium]MQG58024.1 thioredoxin reductase [SAR202 cluster bacterium]|tara:strand:- start:3672 stop:4649 length:978 start_codon:yes stop_codon:yes gene_type:complete